MAPMATHPTTHSWRSVRWACEDDLGHPHRVAVSAGLSVIVVLGAALRWSYIGQESLWFDEAWSWRSAHLSLSELWTEALDLHPPLYYSLQRLWLAFGQTEAALRSLSAVLGTSSIVLAFLLGRSVLDSRAGLVAALLTATSVLQVAYSQEARSYSLLAATALLVSLAMVAILRLDGDRLMKAWSTGLGYVLSMLAALYTHNIAALLFVVAGAVGLLRAVEIRSLRFALAWCVLNGIVVIGWAWWLPVVVSQSQGSVLGWQASLSIGTAVADLRTVYGEPLVWHFQLFADFLLPCLAIAGAIIMRRQRMVTLYLLAVAVGIPAMEIAISFAGKAIFMSRSIVWLAPIYFVLAAAPFARLHAFVGVPLLLLVASTQLVAVYHYYGVASTNYALPHKDEPWRGLVSYMVPHLCDGDMILLMPMVYDAPFSFYFHGAAARDLRILGVTDGRKGRLSDPRLVQITQVDASGIERISASAERIWLVGRQTPDSGATKREAAVRAMLSRGRSEMATHADRNLRVDLLAKPSSANGISCPPVK